jgi:hypothetical protein
MRKRDREVHIRFDDDGEVEDGRGVRVPMMLCDGYRPGYVQVSDAHIEMRRRARAEMIDRATQAWVDGGRVRHREPRDDYDEDNLRRERDRRRNYDARGRVNDAAAYDIADAARTASYLAMCQRLQDAWKSRPADAAQPDMSSRPEELMSYHLRTEPDEPAAAQARRDRAWAAYKDQLSTAWMRGRTDPREADVIERQGEKWRGGR